MSAVTVPNTQLPAATKVPFGRLVVVEWRKMTDTRSGFWMLSITVGLLALIFALVIIFGSVVGDTTLSASLWMQILSIPVSLLVPVLAITIVTQEWGQRTAMVTFALEPSRLKVVLAKLLAVVVLGVVTIAIAFALGAIGTALSAAINGDSADWHIKTNVLVWTLVTQVLYLLMGFGLGLLLLSSPGAVAIYYVYTMILEGGVIIPGIFSVLYFVFDWAQSLFPWISMRIAIMPFAADADTTRQMQSAGVHADTGALGVAHLVTSIALWVGVPLVLGTYRLLRTEVK